MSSPLRLLLLTMLGFLTGTGCTNSGFLPWNSSSLATSSESGSAQPEGELPPKEAARACFVAAEEMQKSGQVEQAISLYEKARRNDPDLKSVAHHLAVLYDAQGDSTRSLSEYNKAVESDPKNPGLLSDLGYYYYERGNHAEGERSLRKALAIDPNHPKASAIWDWFLPRRDNSTRVFRPLPKWSVPPRPIPMSACSWPSRDVTTRPGRPSMRPSPWTLPCNNPRHSWPTLIGRRRGAERHHPTPVRRATRRRSRRSLAARRPAGESRPRPGDARSPNRRSDRRPRAPASARAPAG